MLDAKIARNTTMQMNNVMKLMVLNQGNLGSWFFSLPYKLAPHLETSVRLKYEIAIILSGRPWLAKAQNPTII